VHKINDRIAFIAIRIAGWQIDGIYHCGCEDSAMIIEALDLPVGLVTCPLGRYTSRQAENEKAHR
jgi:hypothetical protein